MNNNFLHPLFENFVLAWNIEIIEELFLPPIIVIFSAINKN